ncbi:MAG: hypothetical protein M3Y40_03315 [Chloroflexota bacterium]|nr:hypothetical protein [Chloroflexota bacterium]
MDDVQRTTDENDGDDEVLDGDRQGGWAGVPEALEDPISGDETPGSQGEIEAGSEGDFGDRGS